MYKKRILLIVGIVLLVPALAARWTFFWLQASALAPLSILFSLLLRSQQSPVMIRASADIAYLRIISSAD